MIIVVFYNFFFKIIQRFRIGDSWYNVIIVDYLLFVSLVEFLLLDLLDAAARLINIELFYWVQWLNRNEMY